MNIEENNIKLEKFIKNYSNENLKQIIIEYLKYIEEININTIDIKNIKTSENRNELIIKGSCQKNSIDNIFIITIGNYLINIHFIEKEKLNDYFHPEKKRIDDYNFSVINDNVIMERKNGIQIKWKKYNNKKEITRLSNKYFFDEKYIINENIVFLNDLINQKSKSKIRK